MDPIEAVEHALAKVYRGRAWLLACDHLASGTATAARLHRVGAERSVVVAAHRGVGEAPDPLHAHWCVLGVHGDGVMGGIRAALAALADVPPHVQALVDELDPERRMRAIGDIFAAGVPVAERASWGGRPAPWQALEDKTRIAAVWRAARVPYASERVVSLGVEDLARAFDQLGVDEAVVAADDSLGFHGGASYTRPLGRAGIESLVHGWRTVCRTVRVMPWLDGVPCSIAGIVLPGHVLTVRPAELLVSRRADGSLAYHGAATVWQPEDAVVEALRDVARRVGQVLSATHGYRGVFVVDGILTEQGFLPTELNPRVGASVGMLLAGLPPNLLNTAWVEGCSLVEDPIALEGALRARNEGTTAARGNLFVAEALEPSSVHLARRQGEVVEVAEAEAEITIRTGPSSGGGIVMVRIREGVLTRGERVLPHLLDVFAWADARYGLGVGPLRV